MPDRQVDQIYITFNIKIKLDQGFFLWLDVNFFQSKKFNNFTTVLSTVFR